MTYPTFLPIRIYTEPGVFAGVIRPSEKVSGSLETLVQGCVCELLTADGSNTFRVFKSLYDAVIGANHRMHLAYDQAGVSDLQFKIVFMPSSTCLWELSVERPLLVGVASSAIDWAVGLCGVDICEFCVSGQNVCMSSGEVTRIFCASCQVRLASNSSLACLCGGRRHVDGMGVVSRMCIYCHKSTKY
jgi:hypothetical protein